MSTAGPLEIYFDFDNTITDFDVLDDIILRFSIDDNWKQVEADWHDGKISSRECLERQLAQVRVAPEKLREYLLSIKIDSAFAPLLELLRANKIEPLIVSDSFSSVIGTILENNGVRNVKILSNEMRLDGDRPVVTFPYFHSICTKCGNCKTSHLLQRNRAPGTRKIYVGDGQSDVCPAGFCEIMFAKGSLLQHYSKLRPDCIPFEHLDTVLNRLKIFLP